MTGSAKHRLAALVAAISVLLVLASPAMARSAPPPAGDVILAAVDGTLCGEVTAFTAPTLATDGSLTINGTVEVIEASATALIDATTLAVLTAAAAADVVLCLTIDADGSGNILDIGIAASAQVCGEVGFNVVADAYTVDGVLLPSDLVDASADLEAVLAAAVEGGLEACATLVSDTSSGAFVALTVSVTFDVCGSVTLEGDGDAVVGGTTIVDAVLDVEANLRSALELAAEAGVDACVDLDVSAESDGTLSVDGDAVVTICATVDAIGANSITLNGEVFSLGDGSFVDSDVTVGAEVALRLTADTDGSVAVVSVTLAGCAGGDGDGDGGGPADGDGGGPADGDGPGDDGGMIPDTAISSASLGDVAAMLLLVAIALLGLLQWAANAYRR
jgi:hypothetical protein